jgi:hypothetical protein
LRGVTILLLITYFRIDNRDSIEMAKNLGTSKWESPKFLILPIYEFYNFMGLYLFHKNYISGNFKGKVIAYEKNLLTPYYMFQSYIICRLFPKVKLLI